MSVQCGIWNFDGAPIEKTFVEKVRTLAIPYAPDSVGEYSGDGVHIEYFAFETTREARRETQPHTSHSGNVITWDGRLDNRPELLSILAGNVGDDATDCSIVAAAYDRWGRECFRRLLGDWALVIWEPKARCLVLGKDFLGARHLYYAIRNNQIIWSTILEPLVLCAQEPLRLKEEYIAGWLSFFPAPDLTPYENISAVPPSSFVSLAPGRRFITKYWDFDPEKKIRYPKDVDYENHFRSLFSEAARRRLRSDSPVLAELSGGMDSSSIVCMADLLMSAGKGETARVDTVSYYDDTEPNWDERPYFTKVEERRGRSGCHIDVSGSAVQDYDYENQPLAVVPGAGIPGGDAFRACIALGSNRVLLSGIGGDEVTGGVPTPTPELEDILARFQLRTLAHQLKVWALDKRKPWFHLLFEAMRSFFPTGWLGISKHKKPAPWLDIIFLQKNIEALGGYEKRIKFFGPLPTFQENLATLDGLRRQLECDPLPIDPVYEKRYPYLDRDLLEFMYAVPRQQLVRPGQRRSLMRRALAGIVPQEILERRRKAYVARGPMVTISSKWGYYSRMTENMVTSAFGIVDRERFLKALDDARSGKEVPLVTLMRTLSIERWLKGLQKYGIVHGKENEAGLCERVLPDQSLRCPVSRVQS